MKEGLSFMGISTVQPLLTPAVGPLRQILQRKRMSAFGRKWAALAQNVEDDPKRALGSVRSGENGDFQHASFW